MKKKIMYVLLLIDIHFVSYVLINNEYSSIEYSFKF